MYLRYTFRQVYQITVFSQLFEPLGTKTCSNNQKVWIIKQIYMKSIVTVILYSQVISLLVSRSLVEVLTSGYVISNR